MPESTFLQIQGGAGSTPRMIELPPGPVRIGRGAHCEVRIDDPGLGDVQCMLRRRGTTWHFQPVGPPGKVWIEGRTADQQHALPLGVPFRVGDHWLTLRPADSAFNDWGTFDAPIGVDPVPEPEGRPEMAPTAEAPAPESPRSNPSSDDEERLRRWETRLEQRERWLKDRQEERRWEARWKSAGESIRTRSTPLSAQPSASPRSTPPTPPPVSNPTTPRRPTQTPPVARIIEPRSSEPIRRVAEPTPRPSTPRVVVRTLPDPPATDRRTAPPQLVRVAMPPVVKERVVPPTPTPVPQTRALVTLPVIPPVKALEQAPPAETAHPVEVVEPIARTPVKFEALEEPARVEVARLASEPLAEISVLASIEAEVEPLEATVSANPPVAIEEELRAEIEEFHQSEIAPMVAEPFPARPEFGRRRVEEPRAEEEVREVAPPKPEWPSARAIFAAQGRRTATDPVEGKPRGRRSAEPRPTEALGPNSWSMPLWLGWFPVLLGSLVVGVAGVALACDWAAEAAGANFAIRMAVRPEGTPSNAIDATLIPRGGWWASTAPHLSAWAMALVRAGDGEDRSEDVRSLMDAARHASRLGSRSRFVLDWPESAEAGAAADLSHLGRTRDVVSLAWTGRELRKEGKIPAAIRAYRSAMEIASKTSVEDLDPPAFFDDPQIRRYALPREALLGLALKAMAEDGDWNAQQWAEALPPTATASMVASRVFARLQRRADADRLADLAIRQSESSPPQGYDPAEDRAAGAEALAYRLRWTDAAEQYRLAIDLAEDDATRRMWWLNKAEVAQRLGDDAGRALAIEAAKSSLSIDHVTRRALEYQRGLPGLASSPPRR